MPEFTNQGNVKITDGAAPGEKRLDVDTLASLQVLEVLADQVDAETVDVNELNANLIREGGARIIQSAGTAPEGYVRFADGTQIAWKTVQTTAINNSHGGVYISAVVTAQPWPASFFGNAPKVASQTISDSGNAPRWHGHGTGLGSTTTTPPVWAIAGVSTTNTATIRMVGIGRWKE